MSVGEVDVVTLEDKQAGVRASVAPSRGAEVSSFQVWHVARFVLSRFICCLRLCAGCVLDL